MAHTLERAAGRLSEIFFTLLAGECRSKLYSSAVRERKSLATATLLGPKLWINSKDRSLPFLQYRGGVLPEKLT